MIRKEKPVKKIWDKSTFDDEFDVIIKANNKKMHSKVDAPKILFSPVGSSDPATELGYGPLICICKEEKPDIVYLFLSRDMQNIEEKEQRYSKAVKRFLENAEVVLINYNGSPVSVDDIFNAYTLEFDKIAKEHPDSKILLNTTSGTSQMTNALILIDNTDDYKTSTYQVITPHIDREFVDRYNPEWLENAEKKNMGDSSGRVKQTDHEVYKKHKLIYLLKELLGRLDFKGALDLIASEKLQFDIDENVIDEVKIRERQVRLDNNAQTDEEHIKEFLELLRLKLLQKALSEFTILLSAALRDVALFELRKYLTDDEWSKVDEEGIQRVDNDKIRDNLEIIEALSESFKDVYNPDTGKSIVVYDKQAIALVKVFSDNEEHIKALFTAQDFVKEGNRRNLIAHGIKNVPVDKDGAKKALEALCTVMDYEPRRYENSAESLIARL